MYRMVFTQVFCRLIMPWVVIVFSSCSSYRVFQVEILQPSTIDLEDSKRVALLYRNNHLKDDPVVFSDKLVELRIIDDFTKGLNHVFMDMSYDKIDPFCITKEHNTTKTDILPLPVDTIVNWCDRFNVDYIVSLEMIHYKIQNSQIYCNWFIRLYKVNESFPIESIVLRDTLPESTAYYNSSREVLLEDIRISFWDKGAEYARRISPYWVKSERRVYDSGKTLGMGDFLFKNGHIEEAINIWMSSSNTANKKAIKSNINLAWVYENSGDFETALEFLLKAEKIAKQKNKNNQLTIYIQEYLQKIQQRMEKSEILDRQIISIEN